MQSLTQLSWQGLLQSNCAALFQTALLLSADPQIAEASISAAIAGLDVCSQPRQDESSSLQKAVARHALRLLDITSSSHAAEARTMLQNGLWPVLQLEKFARACFVLRFLLGYSTSCCAQLMGLEETEVQVLVFTAILQLEQAGQSRSIQHTLDTSSASSDHHLDRLTSLILT